MNSSFKVKFFVTAMTLAFSTSVFAQSKVATIDMQRAVQSTAAGKKAKAELEAEFDKRKKEIQKREADLKKMGEDIEKKKSVLSEESLQKKQAEFQEEMMKYRDAVGKSQVEIQKKDQDLTKPILDKMRSVVEKVAKEKGFTLVLESSAMVLFASKEHDITDDVIKLFEKEK